MYTWQVLSDLGFDHLLIFITIRTSPKTNSTSRSPSFNCIIKPAGTNTFLISTPTSHLLQALLNSLSQKPPPTPSPNSSMMLPLLPFLSATSTGSLLQERTVLKKIARTISLSQGIPLHRFQRLKLTHGRNLF